MDAQDLHVGAQINFKGQSYTVARTGRRKITLLDAGKRLRRFLLDDLKHFLFSGYSSSYARSNAAYSFNCVPLTGAPVAMHLYPHITDKTFWYIALGTDVCAYAQRQGTAGNYVYDLIYQSGVVKGFPTMMDVFHALANTIGHSESHAVETAPIKEATSVPTTTKEAVRVETLNDLRTITYYCSDTAQRPFECFDENGVSWSAVSMLYARPDSEPWFYMTLIKTKKLGKQEGVCGLTVEDLQKFYAEDRTRILFRSKNRDFEEMYFLDGRLLIRKDESVRYAKTESLGLREMEDCLREMEDCGLFIQKKGDHGR